jgi:hypothetical protein
MGNGNNQMDIFGNINKVMKKLLKKLFKKKEKTHFYSTDVWSEISEKYDIKNKLWNFIKNGFVPSDIGDGIILYGEIYGAGIQKGYDYGLKEILFAGFDIKVNGEYLNCDETDYVITNRLKLPYVEILYEGPWSQEIQDKYTFNNFIPGTKVPEEGIVIKHISGERQRIAKVINPDYSIYSEKHNVGDSH